VHKVTDLLLSDDPTAKEALDNLKEYEKRNPSVVVIDPVDALQYTNFRSKLPTVWKETSFKGIKIRCPRLFEKNSEVFPCIVKTDVACQVSGSHEMTVVHDFESLQAAKSSFQIQTIVQEWIPHIAMFKVYILGEFFQISPCKVINVEGTFKFNSTRIPDEFSVNSTVCLDEEVVSDVNRVLKEVTGLGLISYDLAVQDNGDYVIVDLNYFPGYYTVANYGKLMDEFIVQSYLKSSYPKPLPN
jgi:hypothetical protein